MHQVSTTQDRSTGDLTSTCVCGMSFTRSNPLELDTVVNLHMASGPSFKKAGNLTFNDLDKIIGALNEVKGSLESFTTAMDSVKLSIEGFSEALSMNPDDVVWLK